MRRAVSLLPIPFVLLLSLSSPVAGQRSYNDLQQARDSLAQKEQRLLDVRDRTTQEIDQLNTRLESLQQLLDAINTRLSQTRSAERRVDNALNNLR